MTRCAWAGVFAVALLSAIVAVGPTPAQDSYAPGDTLWLSVAMLDSAGVAILPDSARAMVYAHGSIVDSSQVYPDSMTALTSNRNMVCLNWDYVLPTTWDPLPTDIYFKVRASGDGFSDDWLTPTPASVRISGAFVDSLSANAVADLWYGITDETRAVIDTSDCTNCGIYTGAGAKITGADVYAVMDSTFTTMSDGVGFAVSANGYWKMVVPKATNPDTVWVYSYWNNQYNRDSPARVILD